MTKSSTRAGKLTVFLGASSGVGKTFAMLEAGYEKLSQSASVYLGCIDDVTPDEFNFFLNKIPFIAGKECANNQNEAIDLNAIRQQNPDLILIDNLAKRNQKGQRHANRYQDVEELLQSGIDVYTTLNIYQIESLKDIIEQITAIKITETVPDSLLEIAEIKLIDISHEDLWQRLKTGKVSLPANVGQNPEKFYRPGNVNALRELALRYTAQRVDKQLSDYMKANDIKGPWPAGDRILACIGPSPFSAQVIRAARRMAVGLKG